MPLLSPSPATGSSTRTEDCPAARAAPRRSRKTHSWGPRGAEIDRRLSFILYQANSKRGKNWRPGRQWTGDKEE